MKLFESRVPPFGGTRSSSLILAKRAIERFKWTQDEFGSLDAAYSHWFQRAKVLPLFIFLTWNNCLYMINNESLLSFQEQFMQVFSKIVLSIRYGKIKSIKEREKV